MNLTGDTNTPALPMTEAEATGATLPADVAGLVERLRDAGKMPRFHDALAAANLIESQAAQISALRGFAQDVMQSWPEGDVDGLDLQNSAVIYGLLKLTDPAPTEPCGGSCACAGMLDAEDWAEGAVCYRRTPLLSGEGRPELMAGLTALGATDAADLPTGAEDVAGLADESKTPNPVICTFHSVEGLIAGLKA